jgi:hypothetical protein
MIFFFFCQMRVATETAQRSDSATTNADQSNKAQNKRSNTSFHTDAGVENRWPFTNVFQQGARLVAEEEPSRG